MRQRAEEIFFQALELGDSDRSVFVRGECAGDDELRQEVESLLRDAAKADAYFPPTPQSPDGLAGPSLHSLKAGDTIGVYTLKEKLGEGGFGEVWLVEQNRPIQRKVAMKVMKAGLDTEEFLARFDSERQALAIMDHPNIARVLDAGSTPAGRSFFIMELVNGPPLTLYCDRAAMDTRQRLSLFLDVCGAIGHAHQKGVIHRDIKPSNVLVIEHGGKPMVKVIDFGIAKATEGKLTDRTLYTQMERFLGTPAYMSPEQAGSSGGGIDTRSDVYGLGVLLYELLTGAPPFENSMLLAAGYEEMRRIIREVEPTRPTQRLVSLASRGQGGEIAKARNTPVDRLERLIAQDLDWIILKALEKDPGRRYASSDAFASDIVRFLAGEPVDASPPSFLYTFGKFARRHRGPMAAASAFVLLLMASTGVSLWLARRATNAEKQASDQLAQTTAERDAKDSALKNANAITGFLGEIFKRPDPNRDGRTVTVAEALAAALPKMDKDLEGQPGRQAKLLSIVADTYESLGLYRDALNLRERVLKISDEKLGPNRSETLEAKVKLEHTCRTLGFYDQAEALSKDLKSSIKELGMMQDRKERSTTEDSMRAVLKLASNRASEERYAEAIELFHQILDHQQAAKEAANAVTVEAYNQLADICFKTGKRDDTVKYQEQSFATSKVVFGPEHDETLKSMEMLAFFYWKIAGRTMDALDLRQKLVAIRKKTFGPDHLGLLSEETDLGLSLFQSGLSDKALPMLEAALPRLKRVAGPDSRTTADAMANLSRCYTVMDRTAEGLGLLEECGPKMSDDTYVNQRLAALEVWFGKDDAFEATRQRMLQYMQNVLRPTSRPHFYDRTVNLCCLRPVINPEMRNSLSELLSRSAVIHHAKKEESPDYLFSLGLFQLRSGNDAQALASLNRVDELYGKRPTKVNPTTASLQAIALHHLGRNTEAQETLRNAKCALKPIPDENEPLKGHGEYDMLDWIFYREACHTLGIPFISGS